MTPLESQTHPKQAMCGLAVLDADENGDEIILADSDLKQAIVDAAASDDVLLRRPAAPLAKRLNLA